MATHCWILLNKLFQQNPKCHTRKTNHIPLRSLPIHHWQAQTKMNQTQPLVLHLQCLKFLQTHAFNICMGIFYLPPGLVHTMNTTSSPTLTTFNTPVSASESRSQRQGLMTSDGTSHMIDTILLMSHQENQLHCEEMQMQMQMHQRLMQMY